MVKTLDQLQEVRQQQAQQAAEAAKQEETKTTATMVRAAGGGEEALNTLAALQEAGLTEGAAAGQ